MEILTLRKKYWTKLQFPESNPAFTLTGWIKSALNRRAHIDSAGNISITRQQIYIIPTRYGFTYAIMVIAMLIGSNNYGINLGFLLTFLLAGVGLATMFQTWKNMVGLQFSPVPPKPVFCGDIAEYPVYVGNHATTHRPGIQLKLDSDPKVFDLEPNSRKRVVCTQVTVSRGYCSPGRWTVMSYFPLGMFYTWAYFESDQKCLVYPKPAGEIYSIQQFAQQGDTAGESDENMDFFGHRKYEPGDNLRRLDWKALARGRGELIKLYTNEHQQDEVWIDFDQISGANTEIKLSIMCRAVLELTRSGICFGLSLPNQNIDPGQGEKHQTACLTALALF